MYTVIGADVDGFAIVVVVVVVGGGGGVVIFPDVFVSVAAVESFIASVVIISSYGLFAAFCYYC